MILEKVVYDILNFKEKGIATTRMKVVVKGDLGQKIIHT